jgi:hypothetical protein
MSCGANVAIASEPFPMFWMNSSNNNNNNNNNNSNNNNNNNNKFICTENAVAIPKQELIQKCF